MEEFSYYDPNLFPVFRSEHAFFGVLSVRVCPATYAIEAGVRFRNEVSDNRYENMVVAEFTRLGDEKKTYKTYEVIYFNFMHPAEDTIEEMKKLPMWVWEHRKMKEIVAGSLPWANKYEIGRLASLLFSWVVNMPSIKITLPALPNVFDEENVKKYIEGIEYEI